MDLGVAPDIAKGVATWFKMPISFKQVNTGWYYLKVNCINIEKSNPWAVPRIRIYGFYLDVLRLKVLEKILDFQSVVWYHIDTKKGEIKMVYRVYRRMMRKFARFILSFDNCPVSYRKNYKEIAMNVVDAVLLCAITIALFCALVINCWKAGWLFVWFSLGGGFPYNMPISLKQV